MVLKQQLQRFSSSTTQLDIDTAIGQLIEKYRIRERNAPELLQSISHILSILRDVFAKNPEYLNIMETLIEPEMQYAFRVAWVDDQGMQVVNRGYRIHQSSALGPYKGGLRFHPTVTDSVVRFLALEQTFKNSLTGLALGSGKGGSDFDPKGKSDNEIMRFCQSFMTALHEYIGPSTDVPAGDIGVGGREIGYLYGQYKRLQHRVDCSLTGKGLHYGGSNLRPEATGYGVAMIAGYAISKKYNISSFSKLRCNISGSGNVAIYLAEYLIKNDATVQTLSDSTGTIYCQRGFDNDKLKSVMNIKFVLRRSLVELLAYHKDLEYFSDKKPWDFDCDFCFPCATENELTLKDATKLTSSGTKGVFEGANMPLTIEATNHLLSNNVIVIPGIAANSGGVAVSGFEMAQNAQRTVWTREEVEQKLKTLMEGIYDQIEKTSNEYNKPGDLVSGAYIASFLKLVDAIVDQGTI